MTRVELSDKERQEAVAYIDAVLARAEGAAQTSSGPQATSERRGPLIARLVPGFVKRGYVRGATYLLGHPFEHLAHPLQTRLEEQIGEARAMAQSALRRAEQNKAELSRLRSELERRRNSDA